MSLYTEQSRVLTGVAVTLVCLLSVMGCDRKFPDPNSPVVESVPVQTLVTGIEAGMRIDLAIYLRVVTSLGREGYYFEPADPRYTGELLQGTPDPGGFLLNRPWRARYRVVATCNLLLDKVKNAPAAEKAGAEGFAKTIMAYQLLLNLNYLDDNGIKLDFSGTPNVPFVSKAEAFARIAALLDEANASLAAAGNTFTFKLSSGFAGFDTPAGFARFNRALMARVEVYRGNFQAALTALANSFLNAAGPLNQGVYHVYGTGLGDQLNEIFESPTAPFVKFMAHQSFQTNAVAGDTRFSSKVAVRGSATTFDELTTNLAITITSSSTDRVPVIRNEELILLRAEANIGLGQYASAEADLNIVRTAAGIAPYPTGSTDATNALDRLLFEKRYSLFGEGHRWIDMRRYGRLNQLPIDRPGRDVIISKMPRPETE
jgi:hypothetical protein